MKKLARVKKVQDVEAAQEDGGLHNTRKKERKKCWGKGPQ